MRVPRSRSPPAEIVKGMPNAPLAGLAGNGRRGSLARSVRARQVGFSSRDQNGQAGFLVHTATGRRTPGRYHTILVGVTTPPKPHCVATTRLGETNAPSDSGPTLL